jgi:hypothetical protein
MHPNLSVVPVLRNDSENVFGKMMSTRIVASRYST